MILERYAIFDRKWEKSLTESLLPFARAVPINQGRNLSALNRAGTFWGQSRVCRDHSLQRSAPARPWTKAR